MYPRDQQCSEEEAGAEAPGQVRGQHPRGRGGGAGGAAGPGQVREGV